MTIPACNIETVKTGMIGVICSPKQKVISGISLKQPIFVWERNNPELQSL